MTDDIMAKECRAFQWIGQSIATCDGCGKPIFEHDGDSHSHGGPFSGTFLLKPFDEAVIANWIINEWVDRDRAAYLLSVKEEVITKQIISNNTVIQSQQQHGTYHDKTGPDEEYIEHLENEVALLHEIIEGLIPGCHCGYEGDFPISQCGWHTAYKKYRNKHPQQMNEYQKMWAEKLNTKKVKAVRHD